MLSLSFSFFANVSPLLATFISAACELDRFTFQDSSGHTPQWVEIPALGVSLRCFEVGGSTRDSTVCSGRGSVVILLKPPEYTCRCTVTSVAVKYDGDGSVSQL